jgi:hypothetical protein
MKGRFIGHSVSDAGGTILTMDSAVTEFLYRSIDEVRGVNFAELTHPADRADNCARIAALSPEAAPVMIHKRYLRPGAAPVEAWVQVSRLSTRGGDDRLVGTILAIDAPLIDTKAGRLRDAATREVDGMRQRAFDFGRALFSDHGWEILLEIYLAESEGRLIRPDDLSDRIGEPTTMIWSWLLALERQALIEPVIAARFAIQLTADGFAKIEQQLTKQSARFEFSRAD